MKKQKYIKTINGSKFEINEFRNVIHDFNNKIKEQIKMI